MVQEFVILFKTADLQAANQVCQRIDTAVREFDWSIISPQLKSSISMGVARAALGDSVESLTHRSDSAMYDKKRPDFTN